MSPNFEQQQNTGGDFAAQGPAVGLPWRLMIFSGVLFAFSIFVYFGIKFGYTKYLDDQSVVIDGQLETLAKKINEADQEKFIGFYSQMVNLRTALDKHIFSSNVFRVLEKNVIAPVFFKDMSFDAENGVASLQGFADSFDSLAQQMAVFEKAPEITKVLLENVGLQAGEGGGITFAMKITLKREFLAKPSI